MLTQGREREKGREKERKNSSLSKRPQEKKIDKKLWQKDGQQKILRNIKSRNLLYIKKFMLKSLY